jgi:small subunit ribosomal protein S18
MTYNSEDNYAARHENQDHRASEASGAGSDTRRRYPSRSGSGDRRPPQRRPGGGGFRRRRKVCSFCVDKVKIIDYKDVNTFRRVLDSHGKIQPSRKTGTCAKHQRRLTLAIKRARHLALVPYTTSRTPHSE